MIYGIFLNSGVLGSLGKEVILSSSGSRTLGSIDVLQCSFEKTGLDRILEATVDLLTLVPEP